MPGRPDSGLHPVTRDFGAGSGSVGRGDSLEQFFQESEIRFELQEKLRRHPLPPLSQYAVAPGLQLVAQTDAAGQERRQP